MNPVHTDNVLKCREKEKITITLYDKNQRRRNVQISKNHFESTLTTLKIITEIEYIPIQTKSFRSLGKN